MKGKISISVTHCGSGEKYISIELIDEASGIHFVDAKMSFEDFAKAITGQAHMKMHFKARGLDRVGKVMEHKPFEFVIPKCDYHDRLHIAEKIAVRICPEGWVPDKYFGSKDSFFEKDGKQYARTTIRRWVSQ